MGFVAGVAQAFRDNRRGGLIALFSAFVVLGLVVFCAIALSKSSDVTSLQADMEFLEYNVEQVETRQGDRGATGPRGPRGYRGEKGAKGECIAADLSSGETLEFECPDAADSETVQAQGNTILDLARQLINQQAQAEQAMRAIGGSGIVNTRAYSHGSASYHQPTYTNYGFGNFHDHANNLRTVGMGEVGMVLNGVQFWTRHNDYSLDMPHPTYAEYHDKLSIEINSGIWPDVPSSVLALPDVTEQIEEMRKYFKAFKEQDTSIAPYLTGCGGKDCFPPLMAYLEGAWITDTGNIEEPFASDRHEIDAETWSELWDKMNFLLASGRKNNLENLAFLPSAVKAINYIGNVSVPVFANFEYRIAVVPLKDKSDPTCVPSHPDFLDCKPLTIPTNRFRVAREQHVQMRSTPLSLEELASTRRARFEVNSRDSDSWYIGASYGAQLIDEWMDQVPGKDNYQGDLRDSSFGYTAHRHDSPTDETRVELNTAYYSRFYSIMEADAMGRSVRMRSFNDPGLWAAMTTADKVLALSVDDGEGVDGEPNVQTQKWTYAVPLEIIYMTPLVKWNPYDITYHGESSDVPDADGRNGCVGQTFEASCAYDGTDRNLFFRTPATFFAGTGSSDAADTSGGDVAVLDRNGVVRTTRASGHWILFPEINGVGQVRQRYPILPVHAEGNTIMKELKAFQDILLLQGGSDVYETTFGVTLELTVANGHIHTIVLSGDEVDEAKTNGAILEKTSSTNNAHTHTIEFRFANDEWELLAITAGPDEPHGLAQVTA